MFKTIEKALAALLCHRAIYAGLALAALAGCLGATEAKEVAIVLLYAALVWRG